MTTTAPDVLAELDAEIEFRKTVFAIGGPELERLQSIRTRLAALVEAARPFDRAGMFLRENEFDNVLIEVEIRDLRALASALKEFRP